MGWYGGRRDAAAVEGAFRGVALASVVRAGFSGIETSLFVFVGRHGDAENFGRCVSDHSVKRMSLYFYKDDSAGE